MTKRDSQAGFSLVELAIVLLIIGLIVGGVLKGQDLIHSARLNDVQTTLNEVRAATNTFQDKYVAFPGDFDEPEMIDSDLFNNDQHGGNGDGRLDSGNSWHTGEHALFWAHLAGANLISGVDPTAARNNLGDAGNPSNALEASIGGYYTIGFANPNDTVSDFPDGPDHWVRVATDARPRNSTGAGVFSAVDLRSIDLKADDGRSTDGDILGNGDGSPNCRDGDGYEATEDSSACTGWFRL